MKRLYIILAIGGLLLALCACDQATANNTTDTPTPNGGLAGIKDNIDLYEAIGEIIKFEGLEVHILSGDIVEVFKAKSKDSIEKLYIGQTVGVKKDTKAIEPYIVEDPNVRFTTMGQQIHSTTGEVKEFNDSYLTITKDNKEIIFKLYSKQEFDIGSIITVDYTEDSLYGDTTKEKDLRALLSFYIEANSYELNVKKINRLESGIMMLETEDNDGIKYHVFLVEGCVTNFNYSELKTNDKVLVYPELIREIYPNEVDAKKVCLIE